MLQPLRSVMELRWPRCQAPSSVDRPTTVPGSNLCSGACKAVSTRGAACSACPCLPLLVTDRFARAMLPGTGEGHPTGTLRP